MELTPYKTFYTFYIVKKPLPPEVLYVSMMSQTKSMNFALHSEYKLTVDDEVIEEVDVYMHESEEMAIVDNGECHLVNFEKYFDEVTDEVYFELQYKQDEIITDNKNVIVDIVENKVW